jgi:DNA mismatch endonuclease (patch repair protein)
MDRISPEKRSWNMSRIKSKDTTPERIVRSFLHRNGFRFKLHVKDLPGKPDIVLPKYKTVVFVNGCFWHAHEGCKWFVPPKSNSEFWQKKFAYNVERDLQNYEKLKTLGWRVILVWECEIRHGDAATRLKTLAHQIREV